MEGSNSNDSVNLAVNLARPESSLEPVGFTWMDFPKGWGRPIKEIGFTAPAYIPTNKLSPLYDRTTVEALERDAARYRWLDRNHDDGSWIDYYGVSGSQRIGYFVVDVKGESVCYGEQRYQTFGEAIDAAIAAEKLVSADSKPQAT